MTDQEEILELKQKLARLQKHNEELAYQVNAHNLGPVLATVGDFCASMHKERDRL